MGSDLVPVGNPEIVRSHKSSDQMPVDTVTSQVQQESGPLRERRCGHDESWPYKDGAAFDKAHFDCAQGRRRELRVARTGGDALKRAPTEVKGKEWVSAVQSTGTQKRRKTRPNRGRASREEAAGRKERESPAPTQAIAKACPACSGQPAAGGRRS